MNARDQLKPPLNVSPDEDYQERGLRILGVVIARHLMKQRKGNGDGTCNRKADDLPTSENDEDVS